MKKYWVFLLIGGFFGLAHADGPICQTIAECRDLKASLENQLMQVEKQSGILGNSFKASWTEIDGLFWSNVLDSFYENDDLDRLRPMGGIVQKSYATEACRNIMNKEFGGKKLDVRLPTQDDFKSAMNTSAFKSLIKGVDKGWFWTSNVIASSPGKAYGYNSASTKINHKNRKNEARVICVAQIIQ